VATYYVRPDGNNGNTGLADSAAGAWATVKYACAFASNAVIVNDDIVHVVADGGAFTENMIVVDRRITLSGLRGQAIIDGTGGAAGSDIFTTASAQPTLVNLLLQNAVDMGITMGQRWSGARVGIVSCGGIGAHYFGDTGGVSGGISHCYVRACGSHGWVPAAGQAETSPLRFSEGSDNTGAGLSAGGILRIDGCLFYDNGASGITATPGTAGSRVIVANSTLEGNTGDGLNLTVTNIHAGLILNNSFSNNSGYGVNCNAAFPSSAGVDYNNYFGNGTAARNNFVTGAADTTNDPGFVNAAGDDYTLDTGSALIAVGYSPFKSPMKLNIGATIAKVAVAGGAGGGPALERGLAG